MKRNIEQKYKIEFTSLNYLKKFTEEWEKLYAERNEALSKKLDEMGINYEKKFSDDGLLKLSFNYGDLIGRGMSPLQILHVDGFIEKRTELFLKYGVIENC
jgi:hypothetical protein